ncbi:hypothetical protein J31TS4_44320 [Paenibacillus sp. J31TS4]|nr:hypothetical protein J31TS4_44320 [Paenibacillus sp. J31TS4]
MEIPVDKWKSVCYSEEDKQHTNFVCEERKLSDESDGLRSFLYPGGELGT